ncbi:mechanosensitive ion channel protein MscS [Mucilaginibacter sp. PAMC 26640]|nr:mechanosensitive ion channel protein MscS [Mucilaginibacter sp. PAMC 26640]
MDINKAYQLITQKLYTWLRDLIKLLPNIILAAIILVIGLYLAKVLKNLVAKLINRLSIHTSLNNLIISIVYIALIGITLFTVLSVLNLGQAVTTLLAGAGIIGLALAFAFQDIAANFMSGVLILFRKPMNVGDTVELKGYMGKVAEINLRDTVIRTFQGQMVIIPNKDVFQNPIENFSILGKRRIDMEIGVSYGDDLEKVKEITLAAVKGIPGISEEDETTMFYTSFADSSINFIMRIWVSTIDPMAFLEVKSEAIIRIKKAYDETGIMIPFPIRTMDFGIKGGVPLSEMKVVTEDEKQA